MLKILIVDDEPPARARLRRLLGPLPGCEVVGEAGSGQEALAQIQRLAPDLLLLDISMPRKDGVSALRDLQAKAVKAKLPPAIAVTANAMTHHQSDYRAAGFRSVVAKPMRLDDLRAAIAEALMDT